jgi:hypothetical protein
MTCRSERGRRAGRDAFNAAHEAPAIRAAHEGVANGVGFWVAAQRLLRIGLLLRLGRDVEQLTHARELLAAIGFGQETVVPNAVEAVGQDVEEKAANELVRGEPHDAALAAAAIVLVTKRHFRVGDGDEPGVADRRPIRGARQIS